MTDPEDLLHSFPEEAPPPEIVLAAVRAFRYRAIAIGASIIAAMFIATFALGKIGPSDVDAEVAAAVRDGADVVPVLTSAQYDGIFVSFSELVVDGNTGYARLLVWDTKGHAEVDFDVVAIEIAGQRQEIFSNSIAGLVSYRDLDGVLRKRTSDAGWFRFESPTGIKPPVVLEVQLLIVPADVVLHGGNLDGPFPILRLEWSGSP
ncbi:hypothetical protein MNBD_ACTINO02-3259 [hydrothermal vent metagenome]|uniref:DUF4179 domain-containing protein n=1 Tax=hydrothermal vent metagenome TaxID=652676 RepID=A0A3B0SVZ3_9ZZZZ